MEGMIQKCGHELAQFRGKPYVQTAEELRKHDYHAMNQLLFDFLDFMENEYG